MPSIYMDVFVIELEAYPGGGASDEAVAALERVVQEFNESDSAFVAIRLDGSWFSRHEIHDAIVEEVRRKLPELDVAAENANAGLRASFKLDEVKIECD